VLLLNEFKDGTVTFKVMEHVSSNLWPISVKHKCHELKSKNQSQCTLIPERYNIKVNIIILI